MSRDKREEILERFLALAKVRGVSTMARNLVVVSDGDALPVVTVFDGTEEVRPDPNGRPSRTVQIVQMEVLVRITVQGDAAAVGSDLNAFRLAIIAAVTAEGAFAGLALNGESPRYNGLATKFDQSRAVQGDMALRFLILYALSPSDF